MDIRHDERLRAVRARLVARGAELRDRVSRVRTDLSRAREPLPRDSADAAIVIENDDVLRAIESTAGREMEHIDRALERMDAGGFGLCEQCGDDIEASRLDVVPYATRCGDCERAA
ncbi:MAG TPA: TraR/DksA family transcriptional regulator [Steroidobacteraceae bacterium]|nr:TraR/DksA family transcriptional regulator [Steroidobacteraceae bacterium]